MWTVTILGMLRNSLKLIEGFWMQAVAMDSIKIQNSVENWNLSFTGNVKIHGLLSNTYFAPNPYNLENTSLNVSVVKVVEYQVFDLSFIENGQCSKKIR